MRRPLLVLAALVAAATGLVVTEDRAGACSCDGGDLRSRLAEAPAAFVGSFVGPGDGGSSRFTVESAVKGVPDDELSVRLADGGDEPCGLSLDTGERVALVLHRRTEDGELGAGLCSTVEPDELLRAAAPLPTPVSTEPARLLVGGRLGDVRLLALDASGQVVGYGTGQGLTTLIDPCPGGRLVAEVVSNGSANTFVAVRDLATLEVRSEVVIPDNPNLTALACLDPDAEDIAVVAVRYYPARADLVHVRGGEVEVAPLPGRRVAFSAGSLATGDRPVAVVVGSGPSTITTIDLRSGEERGLGPIDLPPGDLLGLSVSPDGTGLAGVVGAPGPSRLLVADLTSTPPEVTSIDLAPSDVAGTTGWIGDEILVLASGGSLTRYDRDLVERGRADGWIGGPGVGLDGALVGVGGGLVQTTTLDGTAARPLTTIDSPDLDAVATLPAPGVAVRVPAQPEPTTTTTPTPSQPASEPRPQEPPEPPVVDDDAEDDRLTAAFALQAAVAAVLAGLGVATLLRQRRQRTRRRNPDETDQSLADE